MSVEIDGNPSFDDKTVKNEKIKKRKRKDEEKNTGSDAASAAIERLKKSASLAQAAQQKIKQESKNEEEKDIEMEDVEQKAALHGLTPIPQPSIDEYLEAKSSAAPSIVSSLPKWLSEPILVDPTTTIQFSSLNIASKLVEKLQSQNIAQGFAVQSSVLPLLLQEGRDGPSYSYGGDLCVSAATGSGKTLAYVLPIVQCLSRRIVPRLRCVVIVPTRELTIQVSRTFEIFASCMGLGVCGWTGQKNLLQEQYQLLGGSEENESTVDILVTTPGRLVDHIQNDNIFSLQHLRYLVIDEADRLLDQSFQSWADVVMAEIDHPKFFQKDNELSKQNIAPFFLSSLPTALPHHLDSPVQKLIFSATLTRDPSKIATLRLRNPRLLLVQSEGVELDDGEEIEGDAIIFSVPPTLQEYRVSVSAEKPILLHHLIHSNNLNSVLCFVKSNEGAARLHRLLEIFNGIEGKNYPCGLVSGNISRDERKKMLNGFVSGELKLLVCSDLMARGIDVANTEHVINYDPPSSLRRYVHRIGRTARAGRYGYAWTLVQDHEGHHFSKLLKHLGRTLPLQRLRLHLKDLPKEYVELYDNALETLRTEVYESRKSSK
ncbi:ATP-dependent RNA helicase Dbp6 [Schizosaccharomyces cryophilus OY26]|uniref:ATP-dependent RNA helicase n=1 Tax=Schizosaccharomyces cryophilus (strain OY26 / ATCC MYA-4695 / CBS 11777 / NBRC 106824 / NRRL Y48691) TaxID=653667 RepID=S9VWJ9_SCHCR|nr:ATP-dependent RNA helicase Dbp6 [Schizosaccharomyces cryophilus OY26]EPY52033.1 ATP-dependent RNA helicase Dbp6 [Schizosaccharomyces cryophilus OY26]